MYNRCVGARACVGTPDFNQVVIYVLVIPVTYSSTPFIIVSPFNQKCIYSLFLNENATVSINASRLCSNSLTVRYETAFALTA